MKSLHTFVILASLAAGAAHSTAPAGAANSDASATKAVTAANLSDMAAGEIKKIDSANRKVTIKHGEIKNLDMPAMTMVFQVKDATMISSFKPGDRVHFKAAKNGGAMVVTDIRMASLPGTEKTARPQSEPTGVMAPVSSGKKETPSSVAEMTMGEIRKVDLSNNKVTIKHEAIKSLDMPGMTMVFQVKDAELLSKLKAGDKIRFKAEKSGGAIVVTDIQPGK